MQLTAIETEQTILWHTTSENGHALTVPGVILVCDADTQQATIRVHKDGQFQRIDVPYSKIEVRS